MPRFALVTDEDLARARREPAYRQQLVVTTLQKLIELLNAVRSDPDCLGQVSDAQLREGGDLAVQLSDMVKRLAAAQAPHHP